MREDRSEQSRGAGGRGLEPAAGTSIQRDRRAAPVWWRPALAAAAVVIVLQGVLLTWLLARQGGLESFAGASSGVALEVTFAPDSTESAIRDVLRGVGGRIVDGPSAIGVYVVQLPVAGDDRAQVEAAVERLGARVGVVSHVARE